MSNWFVYMIRASDQRIYTGITTDIYRRWHEHAGTQGKSKTGAKFFRGRAPECLCLLEVASSRSHASQREAQLKKLSRQAKLQLIYTQLPESQTLLARQQNQNGKPDISLINSIPAT